MFRHSGVSDHFTLHDHVVYPYLRVNGLRCQAQQITFAYIQMRIVFINKCKQFPFGLIIKVMIVKVDLVCDRG
ncbi:Uncharacterised protein [Vibrio cholerae]|nr:Uncharacterised protein [Vibrio cholerae]